MGAPAVSYRVKCGRAFIIFERLLLSYNRPLVENVSAALITGGMGVRALAECEIALAECERQLVGCERAQVECYLALVEC